MELALITLQRREDIVRMRRDHERVGRLYVVQHKTRKHDTGYLAIEITPALRDVLNRSIDNVPSPYIVHRKPERISRQQRDIKDHWTRVEPDYLSRAFDTARTEADAYSKLAPAERPGFHQIRALGTKLYKDAGADPQSLAGHASAAMTKNYDAGHDEIRWTYVTADLKLPPKPEK